MRPGAGAQLSWPRQMKPPLNRTRITGVLSNWCFLLRQTATCHRHVSPICRGQYIGTKLSWQADMGTWPHGPMKLKQTTNRRLQNYHVVRVQKSQQICMKKKKIQQYRSRQGASHGKLPSVSNSLQERNYKWQEAVRNEAIDYSLASLSLIITSLLKELIMFIVWLEQAVFVKSTRCLSIRFPVIWNRSGCC